MKFFAAQQRKSREGRHFHAAKRGILQKKE